MHLAGLLVVLLAIAAAPVTVFAVLGYWAQWLQRRTALPSSVSILAYLLLGVGALAAVLAPVASVAREVLAGVRSTAMLSGAMRAFAVAWTVAVLTNTLWLLYLTWRYRWSLRRHEVTRDRPYR